jgi:mRNA-degrading endonuclease RelE of RelBE toxin-antitoxin system
MMKDFVLADRFLKSCIDLPEDLRRKIVSRLRALARDPRDRRQGVARVEGSGGILLLPVDEDYRIFFRREKQATILLSVVDLVSNFGMDAALMGIAPVDALEKLLVEEKYLLLARHLLAVPAATKGLQFHFAEIEEIVSAHLPPEARRFPNWWANQKTGKRPQAFAWMAAGWLVSKVDVDTDLVKFRRQNVESGGKG